MDLDYSQEQHRAWAESEEEAFWMHCQNRPVHQAYDVEARLTECSEAERPQVRRRLLQLLPMWMMAYHEWYRLFQFTLENATQKQEREHVCKMMLTCLLFRTYEGPRMKGVADQLSKFAYHLLPRVEDDEEGQARMEFIMGKQHYTFVSEYAEHVNPDMVQYNLQDTGGMLCFDYADPIFKYGEYQPLPYPQDKEAAAVWKETHEKCMEHYRAINRVENMTRKQQQSEIDKFLSFAQGLRDELDSASKEKEQEEQEEQKEKQK